jgi:hypothetical protein
MAGMGKAALLLKKALGNNLGGGENSKYILYVLKNHH